MSSKVFEGPEYSFCVRLQPLAYFKQSFPVLHLSYFHSAPTNDYGLTEAPPPYMQDVHFSIVDLDTVFGTKDKWSVAV